jgi:glutathione synthase/RimK-type ligase-like ATP-grasp enzyme
MNIIIVRTKKGIKYAQKIQNYILSQGIICYLAERSELEGMITKYNLKPGNTLIHARCAGTTTNKILAQFEKLGFRIINSSKTLELTSNKYLANLHAKKNKLPIAKTYKLLENDLLGLKKLLQKHKTIILKPIHSQGQGIFCQKIDSNYKDAELKTILNSVPGQEIQVQEFIDYKKLIRVIVIDYKVLAKACTYDIPAMSWKCSVCLNPKIKKYNLVNTELKKLAEKTARVFEAQVNFIDFFEDQRGEFILNEINTACSLLIHEKITGVPIHRYIGDFFIKEVKNLTKLK